MLRLGDEVKDNVTGFKGIAVARHTYLQGCNRISIQPPIGKDGKMPEFITFDELQLKIIKIQKIKRQATPKDPGGPDKYIDSGRSIG